MNRVRTALLCICWVLPALGQPVVERLATGSPWGIFVTVGPRVCSRTRPAAGFSGYCLERRYAGTTEWQRLVDLESPEDPAEFQSRLNRYAGFYPGHQTFSLARAESILTRAWARQSADSLRLWSGVFVVRVSLGAIYLDTTAERDKDYEYRVSEQRSDGSLSALYSSGPMHWPIAVPFAPPSIVRTAGSKREALVRWAATDTTRITGAYMQVYRRAWNELGFSRILPMTSVTHAKESTYYQMRDTLVAPMQTYEYYMLPMCAFGNTGAPSETARVATYWFKDVPLPEFIRARSRDSLPGVRLTWHLPEPGAVRSIRVYRSAEYEKGFSRLAELLPTDSGYDDYSASEMVNYYYCLEITDPIGRDSSMSPRVFGAYRDPALPMAPSGLRGEGVKNGVRLSWQWTGGPIDGFQVLRNRGYQDTLRELSSLVPCGPTDTTVVFTDSTADLSAYHAYGYAVRAVSRSHVPGVLTETVYVQPAIPTHPHAPMDLEASVQGRSVKLFWMDMRPTDRALTGYTVFRREVRDSAPAPDYARLSEPPVPASSNSYTDTTAVPGRNYEYAIQSSDAFGGTSPLSTPTSASVPLPLLVPPAGLRAVRLTGKVALSWDPTVQSALVAYRLYRYERGNEPALVAEVKPDTLDAEDKAVQPGRLYFYYVTGIGSEGRESTPSDEVSVRF